MTLRNKNARATAPVRFVDDDGDDLMGTQDVGDDKYVFFYSERVQDPLSCS